MTDERLSTKSTAPPFGLCMDIIDTLVDVVLALQEMVDMHHPSAADQDKCLQCKWKRGEIIKGMSFVHAFLERYENPHPG